MTNIKRNHPFVRNALLEEIFTVIVLVSTYLVFMFAILEPTEAAANTLVWVTAVGSAIAVAVHIVVRVRGVSAIRRLTAGSNTETVVLPAKKQAYNWPLLNAAAIALRWLILVPLHSVIALLLMDTALSPAMVFAIGYSVIAGFVSFPVFLLSGIAASQPSRELPVIQQAQAVPGRIFRDSIALRITLALFAVTVYPIGLFGSLIYLEQGGMLPPDAIASVLPVALAATVVVVVTLALLCVQNLKSPLQRLYAKLQALSESEADLSEPIAVTDYDISGHVSSEFNRFLELLRYSIYRARNASMQIDASSDGLRQALQTSNESVQTIIAEAEEINSTVDEQARELRSSGESLGKIMESIRELQGNIEEQSSTVEESSSAITQLVAGVDSVNKNIHTLGSRVEGLLEAVQTNSSKMQALSESIQTISEQSETLTETNQVIQNIAAQTNLLAMNAAIEAAHAGDAGSGFAVVADEIRKLAERSSGQSRAVAAQLKEIKQQITAVSEGSNSALSAFAEVTDVLEQVRTIEAEVRASMDEQSTGNEQLMQSIQRLTTISQEVNEKVQTVASEGTHVQQDSKSLLSMTEDFEEKVRSIATKAKNIHETIGNLNTIGENSIQAISELTEAIGALKLKVED